MGLLLCKNVFLFIFCVYIRAGCELCRGEARVFNNIDANYWSIAVCGIGPQKMGFNEMEGIIDIYFLYCTKSK